MSRLRGAAGYDAPQRHWLRKFVTPRGVDIGGSITARRRGCFCRPPWLRAYHLPTSHHDNTHTHHTVSRRRVHFVTPCRRHHHPAPHTSRGGTSTIIIICAQSGRPAAAGAGEFVFSRPGRPRRRGARAMKIDRPRTSPLSSSSSSCYLPRRPHPSTPLRPEPRERRRFCPAAPHAGISIWSFFTSPLFTLLLYSTLHRPFSRIYHIIIIIYHQRQWRYIINRIKCLAPGSVKYNG